VLSISTEILSAALFWPSSRRFLNTNFDTLKSKRAAHVNGALNWNSKTELAGAYNFLGPKSVTIVMAPCVLMGITGKI
jgi:hypothetical protein